MSNPLARQSTLFRQSTKILSRLVMGNGQSSYRKAALKPQSQSQQPFSSVCLSPVPQSTEEADYPFAYTSGRWLRADQWQHELRYRKFNFEALCDLAVKLSHGASRVLKFEKKEGGFNRVFLLFLDNGIRVAARIPYRIAGPQRYTTGSEVATIQYLKMKTKIPIPNILSWSDDPTNPVGCEYIIMEHVEGTSLHDRWPTMTPRQKVLCVKALGMLVPSMTNLNFPAYGSIYFANSLYLPETLKVNLELGFCIGPFCNQNFWDSLCGELEMPQGVSPNRGPFMTLGQYTNALTELGRSRIPNPTSDQFVLQHKGLREDHESLLLDIQPVLNTLVQQPKIQEAALPTLMHCDFNKRNIFVSDTDPTTITSIIDWQSTSIEPGFVYANETPDFTEKPVDLSYTFAPDPGLNDLPRDPKSLQYAARLEETDDKDVKAAKLCAEAFELILKVKASKLASGRALKETLLRPFRYAATSSRDGVTASRQEIIELAEGWTTELDLPGCCPYQPTTEQLMKQKESYEELDSILQLKHWLMNVLQTTSDGWVPNEVWNAAKEANKAAFDEWIKSATGSGEMSEDKARAWWPFTEMGK